MKKALKEAYDEAKAIPKATWVAAVIVPGGFVVLASYLLSVGIYKNKKKEEQK